MKITVLFFLGFILSVSAIAQDKLPKGAFGKYGGEMPSYTIENNGETLAITAHDVYITINATEVIYLGGNLTLKGGYSVIKQSKNTYLIKTNLSNGKSLNYELDFIWNKKEAKIYITPKNGQSEAVLEFLGK